LLAATALLAISIGAMPVYAVDDKPADGATTKSHKKNADKDTKSKPKSDNSTTSSGMPGY
jgi:hypothetical protein